MGMGGTRPLRIAFVGSGNMAGLHLAALARVPTAHQLVGVHDVRLEAARAFAQRAGTEAFGSLPTMLAAARPELAGRRHPLHGTGASRGVKGALPPPRAPC